MVVGEAEDVEEDTASAAERAGWAAGDAAQRELEEQSKRRWDAAAGKTAEGQSRPRRAERPRSSMRRLDMTPPRILAWRIHLAQAYNELRTQQHAADGQIANLEVRLGEVAMERDSLRGPGDRLQEQLALLQTEKKELEAASRVELEQLRGTLQEKEASYSIDVDRLASVHLKEMELKDAALREKEGALVQMQSQLAKALESAATLQEEVARLTHASKVRELEILESAHETDGAFHRLFPATQVADTAVEVSREQRRAAGQEVGTTSGWSVEEIGVGLRARLHALGDYVAHLQVAGSSMVVALWPCGMEPASMSRLAR
ncbi:hypothetical protein ZWY2020_042437 [Hordeum vulgare]|nr:hypothetical protein ZWY2020_042437 [Hordeum vulgare]